MVNMYSGRDRGHETITAGTNLRCPAARRSRGATSISTSTSCSPMAPPIPHGQYFFDIFTTDGFLGDMPLVNFAYAPYFEVLPRKYRFRLLNACMSRFLKLALVWNGVRRSHQGHRQRRQLPPQSGHRDEVGRTGHRRAFRHHRRLFADGRRPEALSGQHADACATTAAGPREALSIGQALAGDPTDPVVGKMMEFRVVGSVQSVDDTSKTLTVSNSCNTKDKSQVPTILTEQIPIVAPVRTRVVEFGRSGPGDSRGPGRPVHPRLLGCCRGVPLDGQGQWRRRAFLQCQPHLAADTQARRSRALDLHQRRRRLGPPDPPPLRGRHHHEPGRCADPGDRKARAQGRLAAAARRAVSSSRSSSANSAASYVNHCHNTVHEDFAMLMRIQLLGKAGSLHAGITPTPVPSPDGVTFNTPEILPEGDPRSSGTG